MHDFSDVIRYANEIHQVYEVLYNCPDVKDMMIDVNCLQQNGFIMTSFQYKNDYTVTLSHALSLLCIT